MYILFYARYFDWSGDVAWGDRFITTPVQLLATISIPVLLRYRGELAKAVWGFGMSLACVSVLIQLASVVFWDQLEFDQMKTLGHPMFVIGLRFENIVGVVLGNVSKWNWDNHTTLETDGIHSDTPYFFPFLYKRDRPESKSMAIGLIVMWSVDLGALVAVLWIIQLKARRGECVAASG